MNALSVLIIDDDVMHRFVLSRMIYLHNPKINVLEFSNGAKAFDYIQLNSHRHSSSNTIIFLDINMPVMNGWKFLESFSAYQHFAKLYVISSSGHQKDIETAKQYDIIVEYITKPVSSPYITKILDQVIQSLQALPGI